MAMQKKRIGTFKAQLARYNHLRTLGVRTDCMVQATGASAMLYGVDGIGVSDTMLQHARTAAARAAAPQAGGKNTDSVFHAIDGAAGTADPAFNAHVLPIKQWTQGIWDHTYTHEELTQATRFARPKVAHAKGSPWAVVTGPAAALIVTMERIDWKLLSPYCAIDHKGQRWHFGKGPPAAIAKPVQQSVRTWRLHRLMLQGKP